MRFSLTSLVRLVILLGVGSFVLAVGVAQLAPSGRSYWRATQPRMEAYNGFLFSCSDHYLRMLDPQTGRATDQASPSGDTIAYASLAPFDDGEGNTQLVGRWSSAAGALSSGLYGQLGIIRMSLPDRTVLDRIESDVMPLGRPCWFPTPPARVLFEAGDGKLYRLQFPDARDDGGSEAETLSPRPLIWNCEPPGEENTLIGDPVWLSVPRWKGRLLVALNPLRTNGEGRSYLGARIWWLRLNADGSRIEEAGRMTQNAPPDSTGEGRYEERMPSVVRTPDGRLLLAFLSRKSMNSGWTLKTVPIVADEHTGQPTTEAGGEEWLADDCLPGFPSASPDGHWIHALRQVAGRTPQFERISLARRPAKPERD